jgi:nitrite reductase/ring-hydroxylating ferredoxin subunit
LSREVYACNVNDLPDGQMRCFRLSDTDVLIVRDGDTIHAVQNRCGHMAAALHRGDYTDGVIVCPLHGAAFEVRTGAVEWNAIIPPPMSEYIHSDDARLHKFGELLESIETLPIQVYGVSVRDREVFVILNS